MGGFEIFIEDFLNNMTALQSIGIVIGGIIGFFVAIAITSARYRNLGGGWWEMTEEPMGILKGLLVNLIGIIIGAGVGYLIGSILSVFV